jgi:hypothetical protein
MIRTLSIRSLSVVIASGILVGCKVRAPAPASTMPIEPSERAAPEEREDVAETSVAPRASVAATDASAIARLEAYLRVLESIPVPPRADD